MAITRGSMTDEQRKSIALEYLKAFDNKGVTSSGGSIRWRAKTSLLSQIGPTMSHAASGDGRG